VGENARLAHLHDLGKRADREPFQPDLRRQSERGLEDGGAGLLALEQVAAGGSVVQGKALTKSNDRSILQVSIGRRRAAVRDF
jgi:hypothetical protein